MALERKDRRQDTTTTTGTGTINLGGTADTGYLPFDFTDGATVRYLIQNDAKTEWEVGEGVFTDAATNTLSRVTIYASSNSGSAVNFSAGTKKVFNNDTAKDFDPSETETLTNKTLTAPVLNGALTGDAKSTGATINTGTADDEFVTPKAIADSNIKFVFKGAWATSTVYALNDCVQQGGSGYVCTEAHTSGTFATDLSAGKWALFVQGALYNSHKFSVYRNAAQNSGNADFAKINFDTEVYDIGGNFDSTTNYRFVAPVGGFYHFDAATTIYSTATRGIISIYVNGSEYARGSDIGASMTQIGLTVSVDVELSANAYVEVFCFGNAAIALRTGYQYTRFTGHIISIN